MSCLAEKDQTIAEVRQQMRQVEEEKNIVIEEKETVLRGEIDRLERQLGCVNQQLERSEQVIAQFQRQITELEQLRPTTDTSSSSKEQRASIKLTWREGGKAPCRTSGPCYAAVDSSTLYVRVLYQMFSYTTSTSSWSKLPDSPTRDCPSTIINNLLTLVGGCNHRGTIINQLFSLTVEGGRRRWTEKFPSMPTKRRRPTALCAGTALIIAGGRSKDGSRLQAVEVLNTETLQWFTAADLPKPLSLTPAAVCGDQIYILGESNMYTCSVLSLMQSCKSFLASIRNREARVWREVGASPVSVTTPVSIHGKLLTIGGWSSDNKSTTAVHMYNPTTDSWEVISHMGAPRHDCIAVVLPNNQLMVVGGCTAAEAITETDSVEFAYVK